RVGLLRLPPQGDGPLRPPGSPIRTAADLGPRAAPLGSSRLATSFIACPPLGIHHAPFRAWPAPLSSPPSRAAPPAPGPRRDTRHRRATRVERNEKPNWPSHTWLPKALYDSSTATPGRSPLGEHLASHSNPRCQIAWRPPDRGRSADNRKGPMDRMGDC